MKISQNNNSYGSSAGERWTDRLVINGLQRDPVKPVPVTVRVQHNSASEQDHRVVIQYRDGSSITLEPRRTHQQSGGTHG